MDNNDIIPSLATIGTANNNAVVQPEDHVIVPPNLAEVLNTLMGKVNNMENWMAENHTKDNRQDAISLHPEEYNYEEEDGGDSTPSVEETLTHHSVETETQVPKETRSKVVENLFHNSTTGSTSSQKRASKRHHKEIDDVELGDEILTSILDEKATPEVFGPAINKKLAQTVTKFWKVESQNNSTIKKLKEEIKTPQNCEVFVPLLNEAVFKNKNISYYHKRNDKRIFESQELILKATTAIIAIAETCLEADRNNKVVNSKTLVSNSIDAITLLGKVSSQLTVERKEKLKYALSEDYKSLCDQDHPDSRYLLGDDLPESMKQAKAMQQLNTSLSGPAKRLRSTGSSFRSSASPRAPAKRVDNNQTSSSLNYQGRKKNFPPPTRSNRGKRGNSRR